MAYYDNFFMSSRSSKTIIGELLIQYRNKKFLQLIKLYNDRKNLRLLEIGPGKGEFARLCIKNSIEYEAIEINKSAANRLRREKINVIQSKAPPLNVEDDHFDIIFSNQVFEHMKDLEEALAFIKQCRKKLKSNGLLIMSCPEISLWKADFFAGDYTHRNPTSWFNIQQILGDNNFEVIHLSFYTLIFSGYNISKIIALLTHIFDWLGILSIIFGQRAYKIKTVLLPSFIVVAVPQETR